MKQIITWYGHGTWYMETPKGTKIFIDPFINGNPACPFKFDDIKEADIVCVTHGHNDHLGDAIELVKKTGATLVTLPDVAAYCDKRGIPYDEGGGILHTGGKVTVKDVKITATFALHYSDIWGEEYSKDGTIAPGSGCCGLILSPEGGKSVYFAGDTGIFGDMQLINRLYKPYVSVIPIGGKYVMDIEDASVAAELLGSKYIIPGHYNTFPINQADTGKFAELVAQTAPAAEVVVLDKGGTFEVA
ncbi:MAG: metal-dependent hydrolase [Oscillospiraceae bacterium]|nr:metal-dependent hydrolase [Oscillospiraceae bacterium]